MSRQLAFASLLIPLICGLAAQCAAAKDEPVLFEIAGKVKDEQKAPVKNALVILTDKDRHTTMETHTDKQGHFSFEHPKGGQQMLHVIPSLKSELAQAFLTEVPGDEGRHVLVCAHKGFLISGKVTHNSQPLKRVSVRVMPHDEDLVHGSGLATTDGKGQFRMVLTPGSKTVEVTDIANQELVGSYKQHYKVTADSVMPELKVPSAKPAAVPKK